MNFFVLYHFLIFFIFNSIYLNFMIFLPNLWKGIDEDNGKIIYYLIDSFYFTVCTHSSLGYGDITPKSRYIRLLTSFHMLFVFASFVIEYL